MKSIFTIIINTAVVLFASLTSSFASSAPDVVDTVLTFNSGILVLAFAGFLALVVVVQTVPAVITLYAMVKAAATATKSKTVISTEQSNKQ